MRLPKWIRHVLASVLIATGLVAALAAFVAVGYLIRSVVPTPPPPGFNESSPRVGEPAPDFTLRDVDGNRFRLSDHLGQRPVVVEFGSYSCPYCTRTLALMRNLADGYRNRAEFVFIYCAEAHPQDSPPVPTPEARRDRAEEVRRVLGNTTWVLVDEFGTRSVQKRYGSLENSGFLISTDGVIATKMAIIQPDPIDETLRTRFGLAGQPGVRAIAN